MEDLNTVSVTGRLTRDLELRYTQNGLAIGNDAIAVNRRVKKNGNWEEEANFFEISVFGKVAESLKPYMLKGREVAISGQLKQDRWTDKDGKTNSKVFIIVEHIKLIGGGKGGADNAPQNGPAPQPDDGGFPEDIPF